MSLIGTWMQNSAQGWDWINTIPDSDIGVWKEVYTRATGPVVVREPHVTTDLPLPALAPADIAVSARLINMTDAEVSGKLIGTIGSITFEKSVVLPAHADTVVSMTSEDFAQLLRGSLVRPHWIPALVTTSEIPIQ